MKRLQMLVLAAMMALGSAAAAVAQDATVLADEPGGALMLQEEIAGKPIPEGLHFQRATSPVMQDLVWLDTFMHLILFFVVLLVMVLLGVVIFRYNRKKNPKPATYTHNAPLEIAWTALPVIILVVIAVPSLKLLFDQLEVPEAGLTIKATGNQGFWTYTYPEEQIEFASVMLEPEELAEFGYTPDEFLLATDTRMVVPVGTVVRVMVTAADVVHAWGVPSFGAKVDAMPGRLNETWFLAQETGIYFGQCYELCGLRHAYMPIVVEVVEPAQYAAWVAEQQAANGTGDPKTRLAAAE